MARLQRRSLRNPDEMRPVGRGTLELVELGDTAYGRTTYQPGWRWSEDVRPIVGTDLCDVHHIGFCMQGRLRIAMDGDRRVLGTIMFTDIVGSTSLAARLGPAAWHGLMAEFNETCRATLDRNHGREVQTTGDGLLSVFARPDRAARAGLAIVRDANAFDMQVRVGIHTGEYEPVGNEMRGLAVHIAARVMAVAGADQVVVSAATAALLDPASYRVEPLGPHELKGVPAQVELYGIATAG